MRTNNTFLDIKKRMLERTMELWGINDMHNIDPVIDLLIDVFAQEKEKLHQEIEISDAQLLHRLSRILVQNKWSLPLPSHGLLNVHPVKSQCRLSTTNHFYTNKYQFGKESKSVYFTSLIDTNIINASIKCKIFDNKIQYNDGIYTIEKEVLTKDDKVTDYSCWVGIQITDDLLSKIDEITICILLKNLSMYPYLNTLNISNRDSEKLAYQKIELQQTYPDETHYFEDIISYYKDYFYTVKLDKKQILKSITEQFPFLNQGIDGIDYEEQLLWLKFDFSEVFSKEIIKNMNFEINAVPVVNRKRGYVQHDFTKNGRIVSLPSDRDNYFLNIKKACDDRGNVLKNVLKSNEDKLEGIYSLYFGDIEKFDSRSARLLIDKVSQLIREEGNAFAAMKPEKVNTTLHEIVEKLDEVERKAVEKLEHINIGGERAFLMTYPYPNTTNYEIEYWVSNAEVGNGFDENSIFSQEKTNVFDMKRVRLLTTTFGGKTRRGEREQIDSLRYGLLTRERIVSTEDVKSFIKQQIGTNVQNIEIRRGVMISEDKRKGILRTIEVVVKLKDIFLSEENLSRLGVFLENELAKKSIDNTPYKVIFN